MILRFHAKQYPLLCQDAAFKTPIKWELNRSCKAGELAQWWSASLTCSKSGFHSQHCINQAWWRMPVTLTCKGWRQGDRELKAAERVQDQPGLYVPCFK